MLLPFGITEAGSHIASCVQPGREVVIPVRKAVNTLSLFNDRLRLSKDCVPADRCSPGRSMSDFAAR